MSERELILEILQEVKSSKEWQFLVGLYVKHFVKHLFEKKWDEKKHPRASDGKFGTGGSSSTKPSKPSTKPAKPKPTSGSSILKPTTFAAREQRHAERQQEHLADAINEGADAIPGNAPSDVERVERGGHLTAVEVKTKLRGKAVRMSHAAQARKLQRLEQHRAETGKDGSFHTVAVDHRSHYKVEPDLDVAPTFPCYYKRGAGSFGLSEMEKVDTPEQLNKLLSLSDDKLPDKAKPITRGFWGRYNAEKNPKARAKMIQTALANERKRTAQKKVKP